MLFFRLILSKSLLTQDLPSIYSVENFSRTTMYQIDTMLNLLNYKAVGEVNSNNIQELINSYGNCYSNGMYYLTEDNIIAYETLNHIFVVYFNYILNDKFTDKPFIHLSNSQLKFLLEQLTTKTIFSEHFAAFCRLYQYYILYNRSRKHSLYETISNFDRTTLTRQLDLVLSLCKTAEPIPIDLEELTERQTFISFLLSSVYETPIIFWMNPPVGDAKEPRVGFSGTAGYNISMTGGTGSSTPPTPPPGGGGGGAAPSKPSRSSKLVNRYPRSSKPVVKPKSNKKKQEYMTFLQEALALYDPDAQASDVKKIFAN